MTRSHRSDRLATELLHTSLDVLKRRPWEHICAEQVFLIQTPTELHPMAAMVTGGGEVEQGLMLSRGPGAVANTLRVVCSPAVDEQDLLPAFQQWDRLGVAFAPLKDLEAGDQELLKRAGLSARRETVVPMFLSARPGAELRPQLTRQEMRTLRWSLLAVLGALDAGDLHLDEPTRTGRPFVRLDVSGSFSEPVVRVSRVPWEEVVGAGVSLQQLSGFAEGDVEPDGEAAALVETPTTLAEWKAAELHFVRFIVSEVTNDPAMITPRTLKRFFGEEEAGRAVLGDLFEMSPQASLIEWILADDRKTYRSKTWLEKYVADKNISDTERTLAQARIDADLSIYRVDQTRPGEGIDVEDVLSGRRLTVHDKSLANAPIRGVFLPMRLMRIAQWVFPVDLGPPLSGLQIMRAMNYLQEEGLPPGARSLRQRPQLMGRLWRWFHEQRDVVPVMQNTDGDPLLWHTASFSVADPMALIDALQARTDLEIDEEAGEWVWVRDVDKTAGTGEVLTLGRLELLGEELVVETNSAKRMASARQWLDELPGVAFLSQQTRDALTEAAQRPLDDRLPKPPAEPMPPEVVAELERVLKGKHRAWLDEPVPLLGGLTPRQACASRTGRETVERMIRAIPDASSPAGPIAPPRDELLAELGLEGGDAEGGASSEGGDLPLWGADDVSGRARAIVRISGPAGAGKTTLIEALLRRSRRMIIVARCWYDDSLDELHEQRPPEHAELDRYRAAGSTGEAVLRFPRSAVAEDDFFVTGFMSEFSNAVLLEGESPLVHHDLRVHVVPHLQPGQDLLRRGPSKVDTREDFNRLLSLLSEPGGLERVFGDVLGSEVLEALALNPERAAEVRERFLRDVREARDRPTPQPVECWQIAPGYEGIEAAQVVVVNVHQGADRDGAERLLSELKRLRRDKQVADDVLGWRGSRVAITALAADLSDPADPGVKKLRARIGRTLRRIERV